jgi:hypothetical protein
MRHIIAEVSDVPDATPAVDRRRTPDRRTVWRGGRRDSDWINRPPGALVRLESSRKVGILRRAVVAIFTVLHIG